MQEKGGEKPRRHTGSNSQPSLCEATLLTTAPMNRSVTGARELAAAILASGPSPKMSERNVSAF